MSSAGVGMIATVCCVVVLLPSISHSGARGALLTPLRTGAETSCPLEPTVTLKAQLKLPVHLFLLTSGLSRVKTSGGESVC